ncbi:nitroreductase family protein [Umezakia ovalisporum]|uniref:nitroreductase family protein n=1 Tax=Umezakia ovalisporum TaxID=75695 RepID=UPI0035B6BDC5
MSNLENLNYDVKGKSESIKAEVPNNLREKIIQEVLLNRRSCRSFLDQPIDKTDILELVKAGIYAPSGSNAQNQRFLVIDDPGEIQRIGSIRWVWPYRSIVSRDKLRSREPYGIVGKAAALVFVFADSSLNDRRNNGEYYIWESLEIQNCAASIQNILLLATAKGIGNCWISCSQNMSYSRLLSGYGWHEVLNGYEIPTSYKIQGLIILGYPKQVDENGFPKGEKVHGVVQSSTVREDVSKYLIPSKSYQVSCENQFKKIDEIKLKFYSKIIRFLISTVNKISKKVYSLEKKYLDTLP